ncbi:hypothetical protein EV714DRAFT_274954 [Schizophyllum commune]
MTSFKDVKTKLEDEVVVPFLSYIKDMVARLISPHYTTPTYAPPAGAPYSEFITDLGLPVLGQIPSLLLHRLGGDQTLVDRLIDILRYKTGNEQHKWLVNTPGSGKTRMAFEGMTQFWGIFLTAEKDASGLGSTDLFSLVHSHLDDVVRDPQPDQTAIFDENRKIVKQRFTLLLLSRVYIMRHFLQLAAASSPTRALSQGHKQSWLLLQLLPIFDVPHPEASIPDEQRRILNSDIFEALMVRLIQHEIPARHLASILREVLQEVISLITISFPKEHLLFVIDEAQGLVKEFPNAFLSVSAVGERRPILREIVATLTTVIASWHQYIVILGLGTGLSEQHIREAVATVSGKPTPFGTHSELGAFDTPAAVRAYVQRYVPKEVLETPSGHMLLQRCWELLRGRHRFLANFLVELIRANYQAPHTVFNEYVKMLTAARLMDADEYIKHEDTAALQSTFKMTTLYPVLNPKAWLPSLSNTFALAVATYLMRGEIRIVEGDDEHRMISLGIARYSRTGDISRSKIARIDEPLVLLAGTVFFHPGLAARGATSTLQTLGSRMASHSGPHNWNGFEDFLMFISWFMIFHEPCRLGDFLDIRGGPPGLADEKVVMAFLKKNAIGGVTVHTSDKAGPRPDLIKVRSNGETTFEATKELYYYTAFTTLGVDKSVPQYDGSVSKQCFDQWLQHESAPVCFLSTLYGPDAALHWKIVGGKNDGKLFTGFLQMKYRRYGLNDEGARRAIMSVTPSHLGDARLHARRPGKKANATAGPSTSQASGTGPARKPTTTGKQSKSRR